MQEMWVQSLGQEDPLEKEMAVHSSMGISCLGNSMDRGAQWAFSPWSHKEKDTTEQINNNNNKQESRVLDIEPVTF